MLNMGVGHFIILFFVSLFWSYMVAATWVYSRFPTFIKILFTVCFLECVFIMWVVH